MIHEPIKMVIISLISALFLSLCIIFYKKILKKNIPFPFLLFLISLLPLVSMLRPGTYESGDLSIHSSYAISFFESLKEGNFIPVWEKYMLSGFGYPYFLFTYPLPYYLAAFVYALGLSFISAFKLVAAFSYIFSGFAMYALVKAETKKEIAGFIAAIFYLFAPYHLVDLHFRFAIGEVMAFFLLPTALYFLKKSAVQYRFYMLLALAFGFLILSHQAISLISFIILVLYSLKLYLDKKNLRILILRITSIFLGALVVSFYWIPAIFESVFTYNLERQVYFSPLLHYIFSPSRFGLLYQGHYGELYFPIGYIHLPIFIIAFFIFIIPILRARYFKKETLLIFGLILLFFISFFMMLDLSKPLWETIPFIKGFQFSYRFSIFCAFFSSIIAGVLLAKIKRKNVIYAILAVTILITILNWGNRRVIPQIDDTALKQGILSNQQPVGLGTTIWADADKLRLSQRKNNLKLESGQAKIKEISRNSINHQYLIDVSSNNARFIENTLYFHGWRIKINNKQEMIDENKLNNGLITFSLDKGLHYVVVEFGLTTYQAIGRLISLISLILLFTLRFLFLKRKLINFI